MLMPARIPTLRKTPFAIDPRPLREMGTAHAGLLATARALRALGLDQWAETHLKSKRRQRGHGEAQLVESIVLLQTVGGDRPEDIDLLADDTCLARGLGYRPPRAPIVRAFLDRFREGDLGPARGALGNVLAGFVNRIARLHTDAGAGFTTATIDQGRSAARRAPRPTVTHWAEADLALAGDPGDVAASAHETPLACAQMAFDALPAGITRRQFRGDASCHEPALLDWLGDPQRGAEAGGTIGFCINAPMTAPLASALHRIREADWKPVDKRADGTLTQWVEAGQGRGRRLRTVGVRLLKPRGSTFANGTDRRYDVLVTNLDWTGERLLPWHRTRAETIERAGTQILEELAGGRQPGPGAPANSAWLALAMIAYDVISSIRVLCIEPEERDADIARYRLLLVHLAGRMSRSQCRLRLRLRADPDAAARLQRVWKKFDLPTQSTAFS